MVMDLQKLKTRYETTCQRCSRKIGREWEVYYRKETKAIYCLPCGDLLMHDSTAPEINHEAEKSALVENQQPTYNESTMQAKTIQELSLKLDHVFTHFTVLHSELKTLTDRISALLTKESKEKTTEMRKKQQSKKTEKK